MASFTFCFHLTSVSTLAKQSEEKSESASDVLMVERQKKTIHLKTKEKRVKSRAYCVKSCRAFVFRKARTL